MACTHARPAHRTHAEPTQHSTAQRGAQIAGAMPTRGAVNPQHSHRRQPPDAAAALRGGGTHRGNCTSFRGPFRADSRRPNRNSPHVHAHSGTRCRFGCGRVRQRTSPAFAKHLTSQAADHVNTAIAKPVNLLRTDPENEAYERLKLYPAGPARNISPGASPT
jgi:hypothetical protein